MLVYDYAHWVGFLATAFVLNISPGPDLAFIMGHTLSSGRRHGIAAMLGIWSGALCHVGFAAVGLSAILAASATAFAVVKWVGVGYLAWLGVQALRSKSSAFQADAAPRARSMLRIFLQGMMVDVLNPKVAIFFLAFLPQFVVEGAGSAWIQLVVHGVLIIAVGARIEPPLVLIGDRLTRRLRANTKLALWLDRTLGVLFLTLAARLAALHR